MSTPPDPFEFLKKLWSPMGLPMPGMMTPTLDVEEIEKKIADLKSVENWLGMNLNMLRMSIQGLEMQKVTLMAMRQGMSAAGGHAAAANRQPGAAAPEPAKKPPAGAPVNADQAMWWNMLQPQPGQKAAKPSSPKKK